MIKLKNCIDIGCGESNSQTEKTLTFDDLIKKYDGAFFDTSINDSVFTIDEIKNVKHQSKIRDRIDFIYNQSQTYAKQKNLVGASSFRTGFSSSVNSTFNRNEKTATVKLGGCGYLNAYMEAGKIYTFSFLYHGTTKPELTKGNYPILSDAYLVRQLMEITESISYAQESADRWRVSVTFTAVDTKDNIVGFTKPDNGEFTETDFTVSEVQIEQGEKFTRYQETTVQGTWEGSGTIYLATDNFYDPEVTLQQKDNLNYASFSYQSQLVIYGFTHTDTTVFRVNGKSINYDKNQSVKLGTAYTNDFNAMAFFKGELTDDEIEVVKKYYAQKNGFLFDPNDLSTLFQDAEGLIPVTEVGQPIGLMLDKSGFNNHVSQAIEDYKPTLGKNAETGYYYLACNGSSNLQASNLDFSHTDETTLISTFEKKSGTAFASIVETTTMADYNDGGFNLAVSSYSPNGLMYRSRGTVLSTASFQNGYGAPKQLLATCLSSIGKSYVELRVNQADYTVVKNTQGSGNYSNKELSICGRYVSSKNKVFGLNGDIYYIHCSDRILTNEQIEAIESEALKRIQVTDRDFVE